MCVQQQYNSSTAIIRIILSGVIQKWYTVCFLRHLPVYRESITNHALLRRRWRAEPPSYREMILNAWVHRHWTIQVGLHRFMACKTPFYGVRNNDPIRRSTPTRSTLELNNIRPTDKRHTSNRAMTGVRAHIGWVICKHVGPLHIPMHATTNSRLHIAGGVCRCMSMEPRSNILRQIDHYTINIILQ